MDEAEIKQEVDNFRNHLRENTTLREGSIQLYGRVLQHFYKTNPLTSEKRIINYIIAQNKKSNETHTRAAFIRYFIYKGLDKKYREKGPGVWENYIKYTFPVPKRMPKKRRPAYQPDHVVRKIIAAIENPVFKDISVLRYFTGIRIAEALTIRGEHIDKETMIDKETGRQVKYIKITITKKGGDKRIIGLTLDKAKKVFKNYKILPGFIFIPKKLWILQAENYVKFWKRIQSYERYYNTALDEARLRIGLDQPFASHDIRRNYAEHMRKDKRADLFEIKGLMGHKDIRTTVRYFNDNEEEAVKNMIKYQGGFDEPKQPIRTGMDEKE